MNSSNESNLLRSMNVASCSATGWIITEIPSWCDVDKSPDALSALWARKSSVILEFHRNTLQIYQKYDSLFDLFHPLQNTKQIQPPPYGQILNSRNARHREHGWRVTRNSWQNRAWRSRGLNGCKELTVDEFSGHLILNSFILLWSLERGGSSTIIKTCFNSDKHSWAEEKKVSVLCIWQETQVRTFPVYRAFNS